jgi:retron-type reverse transcriptase
MILRTKIEEMLPNFQHGFRPGRSCATATREVIETLRKYKNRVVHEFDLKSYFNMVNSTKMFFVFKPFNQEH